MVRTLAENDECKAKTKNPTVRIFMSKCRSSKISSERAFVVGPSASPVTGRGYMQSGDARIQTSNMRWGTTAIWYRRAKCFISVSLLSRALPFGCRTHNYKQKLRWTKTPTHTHRHSRRLVGGQVQSWWRRPVPARRIMFACQEGTKESLPFWLDFSRLRC